MNKMYRMMKTRHIHYLCLFLLVTCTLWACRPSNATQEKEVRSIKVLAREVNHVSENDVVFVSGYLEAEKTVPVSFMVPGKVVKVYFDEGDRVKKGEVIAELEIDDYQSYLEIAEAKLLEAQDAHKRLQPLFEEGAVPEKDIIEIQAGHAQAKAGRNIAQKKVTDTRLRSPVSGIIGMKTVEEGQMISPGMPVFTIVKTDNIYAKVSIPESEVGKIATGQIAQVTIPALNDTIFEGPVHLIGVMAEPLTRTYTTKISLENHDFILRTGMIAEVAIRTNTKIDMLTIPGKAIIRDADNLTYVYIADAKSNRAYRRRVYPGTVFKNEIQIKKGLNPGDIVITAGQHKIEDGNAVEVVNWNMAELEQQS